MRGGSWGIWIRVIGTCFREGVVMEVRVGQGRRLGFGFGWVGMCEDYVAVMTWHGDHEVQTISSI